MGPFDVSCEELGRLGSCEAVRVFHDLLFAEASCVEGIDPSKIDVPMSTSAITTRDGGVDAEVRDARPGRGSHGIVKEGLTCYQIKSGGVDVTNSSGAKRMISIGGVINPRVRTCLENNGTLVMVLFGSDKPDDEDEKAASLIRAAIADIDSTLKSKGRIEVWRQNKLCGFLRDFPSICFSIKNTSLSNLCDIKDWESLADMNRPFVKSEDRDNAITALRESLTDGAVQSPIRIIGEPGIGKTRLVLEALKEESLAPLVLYASRPSDIPPGFLRGLLRQDDQSRCILVVDECDGGTFRDICNQVLIAANRVKVVSIFNDHESEEPGIAKLCVEPLPQEGITEIIATYGISQYDAARVASLCGGSPRVAHILGEQMRATGAVNISGYEDIWQSYIAGCHGIDSDVYAKRLRVLEWLSLFARFGYEGPVACEGNQLVKKIASSAAISEEEIRDIISDLRDEKILQGDYTLYITPKLLHLWLWGKWWKSQGPGFDWNSFVSLGEGEALSDGLIAWFCSMLQYAGESEAVSRVASGLLGSDGPFTEKGFISTPYGSKLLVLIASLDPDAALGYAESYLGSKNKMELIDLRRERRCLVDTLKWTAFEPRLFDRSAYQLLRLACAENEHWSNNATGEYADLYSNGFGELAVSKATPEQRLSSLRRAALSESADEHRVAIKAFGKALEVVRSRVTAVPATGMPLKTTPGWKPCTYNDLWGAYRAAWSLAMECLASYDGDERTELARVMESGAISLLSFIGDGGEVVGWLRELYDTGAVDSAKLIKDIASALRYAERLPECTLDKLAALRDDIVGSSYEQQLHRYAGMQVWAEDYDEGGEESEEIVARLSQLAEASIENPDDFEEALPWLLSKEAENAYRFGIALGEKDAAASLWATIANAIGEMGPETGDSQLCSGYLKTIHETNFARWEEIIASLLSGDSLAWLLPSVISSAGISDSLVDKVGGLFSCGVIAVRAMWPLCHASFATVSAACVERLLSALIGEGSADSASLAIGIAFWAMKGGKQLHADLEVTLIGLPDALPGILSGYMSAGYAWYELAENYLSSYSCDAWQIVTHVVHRLDDSNLIEALYIRKLIRRLAQLAPEQTWRAVGDMLLTEGRLLSAFFFNEEMSGLLLCFPPEVILAWVAEDRVERPVLSLRYLPSALCDGEGHFTVTREILAEYGGQESVQRELLARSGSYSCVGSLVEMFDSKIEELERWRALDNNPHVLTYIDRAVAYFREQRERGRIDEERNEW